MPALKPMLPVAAAIAGAHAAEHGPADAGEHGLLLGRDFGLGGVGEDEEIEPCALSRGIELAAHLGKAGEGALGGLVAHRHRDGDASRHGGIGVAGGQMRRHAAEPVSYAM